MLTIKNRDLILKEYFDNNKDVKIMRIACPKFGPFFASKIYVRS